MNSALLCILTMLLHYFPNKLMAFSVRRSTTNKSIFRTLLHSSSKASINDVPLVFLHGIKGSHLADPDGNRRWLTLSGLLNFPPKADHAPSRDVSLPLTYTNGIQDKDNLKVDGTVDHIIEIPGQLELLPFYGSVTKLMAESNARYHDNQEPPSADEPSRPTAVFAYDWRRNLHELSDEFHQFCCREFPDQPVQVLGHSMGGLLAFKAIRDNPQKYSPGATLVGVPFGTGIQYLQDLHKGYFTELGRCRQFLPLTQFTCSSHWIFFPSTKEEKEQCLVDVTGQDVPFEANKASIGKSVGAGFQEAVEGEDVDFDFFSVDSWEEQRIGIFDLNLDEELLQQYRDHMEIQLESTLNFRRNVLVPLKPGEKLPPLTVLASDTIPTINQYLRRKNASGVYEYDYSNGRRVPGDGRLFFTGSFPPVPHISRSLTSAHAKQFTWEKKGGSLGTIMKEVRLQAEAYTNSPALEQQRQTENVKL